MERMTEKIAMDVIQKKKHLSTQKEGDKVSGEFPLEKEVKNEEENKNETHKKVKKIKIGLFLSYSGFEYQGLQMNPGTYTIEGVIHQALIRAGCISEANQGYPFVFCSNRD